MQKVRDSITWAIAGTIMLAIFYLVGCSDPRTTIGVGSGVTGAGGVGANLAPPPVVSQNGPTGAGQQCPVVNPVTGQVICSCASLWAGEC